MTEFEAIPAERKRQIEEEHSQSGLTPNRADPLPPENRQKGDHVHGKHHQFYEAVERSGGVVLGSLTTAAGTPFHLKKPVSKNWAASMGQYMYPVRLENGPNAFQRLMWRVAFGVKWERLDD